MFVKSATYEVPVVYESQNSFVDFDLHPQLTKNIVNQGYIHPTPIQDQAIPALLEGRDVVGTAKTGSGKTAAFLIPMIQKVFTQKDQKVLIVTPTRELAVQIEQEFRKFSQSMNMFSVLCIGGVGMFPQIQKLRRRPEFVIGTPGRLKDLMQQNVLRLEQFNNVILDEVDRMLDMGFLPDVKFITAHLPQERQSLFFSATQQENVQSIMQTFLHDPVRITVKSQNTTSHIEQDIVKLAGREKIEVLHEMLIKAEFEKVIIFIRTKHGTEKLAQSLDRRGIAVAAIHGNKSQNQRQRAIEAFKKDHISVLLATDVASRGLDINNVTHVINYDLPETYEDYVHRIGRTGRANKKGMALTFVD